MSDLISRKEVIEWIENWVDVNKYYHPYSKCNLIPIDEVIDRLQNVPSAEKIGKWTDRGSLSCRCSECGCKSPKEYRYCPNCGAEMVK